MFVYIYTIVLWFLFALFGSTNKPFIWLLSQLMFLPPFGRVFGWW